MASRQRIGVDILANASGFIKGLKQSGTASKDLGVDLEKLTVKVKANAEATVSATVRKQARLREEIATYQAIGRAAEKGSREQVAAANLATQAEGRLARSLGVTAHEANRLNLGAANRDLSRLTRGGVAASGVFTHLGRTVAFASGWFLGGVGFVGAARKSVSEAGALQEQMGRTTEVFRQSGDEVQKWSKDSAQALGLSSAAALDAADTFGTLLQNVGVMPVKAAAMSEQFTKLAVDMAEFKKVSPEVALSALEAALTGRTRSLKQFGLVIDAVAIKAEALRDGILKSSVDPSKVADAQTRVALAQARLTVAARDHGGLSIQAVAATVALHGAQRTLAKTVAGVTGQLTAQQKALATYNLIVRQTTNQQGAFARSSDELDYKQRVFHAGLVNTEAAIGTALLPTVSKYVGEMGAWLSKSENQARVQRDVTEAVKVGSGVVREAAQGVKVASGAVGGLKNALEILLALKVISWARGTAAGLGLVGAEATAATGKVAGLRSALTGLGAISVAPIVIPVAVEMAAKEKSWLQKHLGKAGSAAFDAVMTAGGGGVIGGPQAVYKDLFGPDGKPKKNTSGMSNDPMHDAADRRYATLPSGSGAAAAAAAAKHSVTPKIKIPATSKADLGFSLPLRLQVEKARADATAATADDLKAAKDIQRYIRKALASGKLSLKQQVDAWNELGSVSKTIADAAKKAADELKQRMDQAMQNATSAFGELGQGPVATGPSAQFLQQYGGHLDAAAFVKDIQAQDRQFSDFISNINKLRKRGAPASLTQTLFAQGQSGMAEAGALARAKPATLDSFLAAFERKQKLLTKAAKMEVQTPLVTVTAKTVNVGRTDAHDRPTNSKFGRTANVRPH